MSHYFYRDNFNRVRAGYRPSWRTRLAEKLTPSNLHYAYMAYSRSRSKSRTRSHSAGPSNTKRRASRSRPRSTSKSNNYPARGRPVRRVSPPTSIVRSRSGFSSYGSGVAESGGQHNDVSAHRWAIYLNKKRHYKGMAASVMDVHYTRHVDTAVGQQGVDVFAGIFDRNGLLGLGAASFNSGQFPSGVFQLNPYQKITGSEKNSFAGVSNLDQCYIHYVGGQYQFCNFSDSPIELDVYWLLCRKNVDLSPNTYWSNLMANAGNAGTPAVQPVIGTGVFIQGTPSVNTYGQNPNQHKDFKKVWKTVKYVRLCLSGMQNSKHNFVMHYNKFVSKSYIIDSGSNFIAGYSIVPMVIARGHLIKDSGTVSGGNANSAIIGSTSYAVAGTYKASIKYPQDKRRVYQYWSDGGFPFESNKANQQTINDVDAIATRMEL